MLHVHKLGDSTPASRLERDKEEAAMITAVLNVLEKHFQAIESNLEPREWTDFSCRVGDLADRFEAVFDEEGLEAAVKDLLKICNDYPYIAELLDQAKRAAPEPELKGLGSRVPQPPQKEPKRNPRELANCYHSLSVRLGGRRSRERRR
jgi:hypothetical protein